MTENELALEKLRMFDEEFFYSEHKSPLIHRLRKEEPKKMYFVMTPNEANTHWMDKFHDDHKGVKQ